MLRARSFGVAAVPGSTRRLAALSFLGFAAGFALLPAAPARAATAFFGIDPYHSQAIILVDHFGVSRSGGIFGGLTGSIEFDPEKNSNWSIDVTIPVFSFISTHPPRTDAVKSEQFLDAGNYPDIKFKATKVETKDGARLAKGEMTIRGVTKEVSVPMTLRGPRPDPLGSVRVGLEGEVVVSRADFGIPFDRTMADGAPVIGDAVTILFQVEAIRAGKGIAKNPIQPPAETTDE